MFLIVRPTSLCSVMTVVETGKLLGGLGLALAWCIAFRSFHSRPIRDSLSGRFLPLCFFSRRYIYTRTCFVLGDNCAWSRNDETRVLSTELRHRAFFETTPLFVVLVHLYVRFFLANCFICTPNLFSHKQEKKRVHCTIITAKQRMHNNHTTASDSSVSEQYDTDSQYWYQSFTITAVVDNHTVKVNTPCSKKSSTPAYIDNSVNFQRIFKIPSLSHSLENVG